VKAIQIEKPGGPEALECRDGVAVPEPKTGEVLVKLAASGVNYIDCYYRTGAYAAQLPFTPGMEGAGAISALGSEAGDFAVGDRVAWAMVPGSYAEYAAVPVAKLARLPDDIGFRDGAALMLQGMTAHYLCNSTFPLRAGQVALVHAGAGGVGLLLTQLAKAKGATVITTVSTEEKAALSREAGADHVVLYTQADFAAETRRLTGGTGADVVYDSVGATTFDKSLDSLRPRGYLVLFGASSGPVPPFALQQLAAKGSLYLTRPTLANYSSPEEIAWRTSDLFEAVRSGKLKLRLEHDYPLAEAARAHEDLEARRTTGKLLLIP
jgi:NADPH:quinone reductase